MCVQRSTSRSIHAYSHKHFSLLNSGTYFETLAPNIAGKLSTLTLIVCFGVVECLALFDHMLKRHDERQRLPFSITHSSCYVRYCSIISNCPSNPWRHYCLACARAAPVVSVRTVLVVELSWKKPLTDLTRPSGSDVGSLRPPLLGQISF